MTEDQVLEIIRAEPGITRAGIITRLTEQSLAARWFGADSALAVLFGPNIGLLYPILQQLDLKRLVTSTFGRSAGPTQVYYFAIDRDPFVQMVKDKFAEESVGD